MKDINKKLIQAWKELVGNAVPNGHSFVNNHGHQGRFTVFGHDLTVMSNIVHKIEEGGQS